jgi:hypothetical protein
MIVLVICLVSQPVIFWFGLILNLPIFDIGTWHDMSSQHIFSDWDMLIYIAKNLELGNHIRVIILGLLAMISWISLTRWYGPGAKPINECRCRKCGYILRGISQPRCPECGEVI